MLVNVFIAALSSGIRLELGWPAAVDLDHAALDAVPFAVMSNLMSGLVPALLARHRHCKGSLRPPATIPVPALRQVLVVVIGVAAATMLISLALAWSIVPLLPQIAPDPLAAAAVEAAYGVVVAAVVTPAVLILLYGAGWQRRK